MTYLELCQLMVQELGLAGGKTNTPSSVVGQSGELHRVTRLIADAELQINNQTMNWKYLWDEYSQALSVGDEEPAVPSNPRARSWVKNAFWLDRFGANQKKLVFTGYQAFQRRASKPTEPLSISIKPNGQLVLDTAMTSALTLVGEYFKAPTFMTANADVPAMPAEYHRIIFCRAAVIYGGREDAPEIVATYEPEYIEILDKLEMDQKPEREQEGDPDAYLFEDQCIPGFELDDDQGFYSRRI